MLCSSPYRKRLKDRVEEYGCGRCLPCRINRRRQWASRLELEARRHSEVSVLTLTYSDESCPPDMSLKKRDYQLFLKRFRRRIEPIQILYYVAGEYGGVTKRPHFHIIIFGFAGLRLGLIKPGDVTLNERERIVLESWGNGNVHSNPVTDVTLAYACKHISKSVADKDLVLAAGLEPEFSRMSLRPAIGLGSIPMFVDAFTTRTGCYVQSASDVPASYRSEGVEKPLGRYLRRKLRVAMGFAEAEPEAARVARSNERIVRYGVDGRKMDASRRTDAAKAKFAYQLQQSRRKL